MLGYKDNYRCFEEVLRQYNSYFQRKLGSIPGVYKKSNKDYYCFIPAYSAIEIMDTLRMVRKHICKKRQISQLQLKFLDCGCGIGNIMLLAKSAGYEVYGIEYEKAVCEVARDLTWDRSSPRRGRKNDAIIHGDITTFEHYADYDVIYYYTPIKNYDKRKCWTAKLANDAKIGSVILSYGGSNHFSNDARFKILPKMYTVYEKVAS